MKCQIITYYFISSRTWQRPNCFPYISWVTSCWVESQGFLTATPDGFYPLQAYDIRRGREGLQLHKQTLNNAPKENTGPGLFLRKENVSRNRQLSFPYTSRTVPGGKGHGWRRPRLVEGFATKWEPQVMTWPVSPVNPSLWPLPFSSYFFSMVFEFEILYSSPFFSIWLFSFRGKSLTLSHIGLLFDLKTKPI